MSLVTGAMHGGRTGAQIGALGGPWGAAAGAVVGGIVGGAAAWWVGEKLASEMTAANEQADEALDATTADVTCATCSKNPCAHLACGVPGSEYRGGAHGCVGKAENKIGEPGAIHSHHTPADYYSPLPKPVGPAIQLDATDHYETSSYGAKVHGPPYAPQRAALAEGRTMAALTMDAIEVQAIAADAGDPGKYDEAIEQMMAYANCLRNNGIIW